MTRVRTIAITDDSASRTTRASRRAPRSPRRRRGRSQEMEPTARTRSSFPGSCGATSARTSPRPRDGRGRGADASRSRSCRSTGARRARATPSTSGTAIESPSTRCTHEAGGELPARRPGDRRQGSGHVHLDLPGLLPGPVAPHPLRGLPVAEVDHRRQEHRESPRSSRFRRRAAPRSTRGGVRASAANLAG
jgi:hypothetical protein